MRRGQCVGWTKSRRSGKSQVEVIKKMRHPVSNWFAQLLRKQEVSRLVS
jgi:hypothetical protein